MRDEAKTLPGWHPPQLREWTPVTRKRKRVVWVADFDAPRAFDIPSRDALCYNTGDEFHTFPNSAEKCP